MAGIEGGYQPQPACQPVSVTAIQQGAPLHMLPDSEFVLFGHCSQWHQLHRLAELAQYAAVEVAPSKVSLAPVIQEIDLHAKQKGRFSPALHCGDGFSKMVFEPRPWWALSVAL